MQSYKIKQGQRNAITKPQKHHGMNFAPRQDVNGDWFIWQVEMDFCTANFGFTPEPAEFVEPVDLTGIE